MIFEEFEIIISAIRALDEQVTGLGNALKDYCDGHVICTIGQTETAIIAKAVERTITTKPLGKLPNGTEWSEIEWWLGETDCGQKNTEITYPDGTKKNIATVEDLFNLLVESRA